MAFADAETVVEVLSHLSKLETALSELYQECAKTWQETADLWESISQEEIEHAQYLDQIAEIVQQQPNCFLLQRSFSVPAITTFTAAINRRVEMVRARTMSLRDALGVALDFENSVLEMRFIDYLRFKDATHNNLVRTIEAQTRTHRQKLMQVVQAMRSKNP